jgi:hypothetical protein
MVSRIERRGSEFDTRDLPPTDEILDWRCFNSDLNSTDREYSEVAHVVVSNKDERIDLRPYMIHSPCVCTTTDKLQKVLDIFRYM